MSEEYNANWIKITRLGSEHEEELDPLTDRIRHRPLRPSFHRQEDINTMNDDENYFMEDWTPGPAPDKRFKKRKTE